MSHLLSLAGHSRAYELLSSILITSDLSRRFEFALFSGGMSCFLASRTCVCVCPLCPCGSMCVCVLVDFIETSTSAPVAGGSK